MSSATWKRPASLPFPTVYEVFEAPHLLPNGQKLRIRIQDLTDDLIEESVQHLLSIYLFGEPYGVCLGLGDNQEAVAEVGTIWRNAMKQQVALIAMVDNHEELQDKTLPKIAGINVTIVVFPDTKKLQVENTLVKKWVTMIYDIAANANCFEKYNTSVVLGSFGLSVDPIYRGQGIGERLLKARYPLGRALGVPVTTSIFTHKASQYLAKKLGWDLLFEMNSEDYKKDGVEVFKGVSNPLMQLTAMRMP